MKWKWVFIVLLPLLGFVLVFFLTGGRSLVNLYRNYLSQDIPDKKYTWQDFAERGDDGLSGGYYAGSVGDSVFVWTLSGLKSYQHRDRVSVYRYLDTCGIIRKLASQPDGEPVTEENAEPIYIQPTFDLPEWLTFVRRGDYVSVRYIDEGDTKIIDKIYASSNQHYPIEKLRLEQCQD
jgi:hypothetical protein